MADAQRELGKVIARAWSDDAFKARLMKDPAAALKEAGVPVPAGLQLEVVENTDKKAYIVIPLKPSSELSDDDLEKVAGGGLKCILLLCNER